MHQLSILVQDNILNEVLEQLNNMSVKVISIRKNRDFTERNKRKIPYIPTKSQVDKFFIQNLNIKHRCILRLMSDCGLKVSEIIKLVINDIDLDTMLVKIKDNKGNIKRFVPIPPNSELNKLLQIVIANKIDGYVFTKSYKSEENCKERIIAYWCKKYSIEANLSKKFNPSSLRHFYATYLLENKIPIEIVKELLGIKLSTLEIYIQACKQRTTLTMQEASLAIDFEVERNAN